MPTEEIRRLLAVADGEQLGTPAGFRAARRAYRLAIDAGLLREAGPAAQAFARQAERINLRSASVALAAAGSTREQAAARRSPGDPLAWAGAAIAALELNRAVEDLADPDATAVAARHLRAALQAPAALHPAVQEFRNDVATAAHRTGTLALRHRAARRDEAGRAAAGSRLRAQALDRAAADPFLRVVLLIELDRRAEAAALIDDLEYDDDVRAELNRLAGRPRQARILLDRGQPGPGPVWSHLGRRAAIALDLGEPAAAADLAGRAAETFERWSAGLERDYYRSAATDHVAIAEIYHVAALAHLALGDEATAFGFADRCRATMLRPSARTGSPRDVRRWRAAGGRLAATYERLALSTVRSAERTPAEVLAEVLTAEDEVDEAERQLARSTGEAEAPPGLAEIRRALPADAALLLYQSFDRDLVAWAVRRDGVTVNRIRRRHRDLVRSVGELHAACAHFGLDGSRAAALAAGLAEDLVEPFAGALAGMRRLYVVPHGQLTLVPFAALPLGGRLIGERFVVSMLPAAALLTRPEAGGRPRLDRPALLVGDPAYHRLRRLPGAEAEVRAIAAGLPAATVLAGEEATAANVARCAPGSAVVHLATHGFVDESRPYLSHLALAGDDRVGVPELLGLDLDVDLLVLSACHTGRGRATAGGDVLGLARAAIGAGARHLVVSLWPVDDVSAALTMTTMYERLRAGDDVAAALAYAQRFVRGLDAAGRAAAYGRAVRPITRDIAVSAEPRHAAAGLLAHWAPFVHIGV